MALNLTSVLVPPEQRTDLKILNTLKNKFKGIGDLKKE